MAEMRKCIGSKTFGIEAHEAPREDFPVQPSRKDGLGTMCRTHWREYVRALGRARSAAKAQAGAEPTVQSEAAAKVATKRAARVAAVKPRKPEPIRTRPARTRRSQFALPDPTPAHDALAPEANVAEASSE